MPTRLPPGYRIWDIAVNHTYAARVCFRGWVATTEIFINKYICQEICGCLGKHKQHR